MTQFLDLNPFLKIFKFRLSKFQLPKRISMLLRTSLTPILNSSLHQFKSSRSESNQIHHLQRTNSISLTLSSHLPLPSFFTESSNIVTQNLLESYSINPKKKISIPKSSKVQSKMKSRENGV